MNSYRVVSRDGKYIAQEKVFFGWDDMFTGAWSDMAQEFSSPKAAMEAVKIEHLRRKELAPKHYEQTFYIANNGQICPTRDWGI
jgi:hypothetical protein